MPRFYDMRQQDLLRRWTGLAKACYKRGCVCEGCQFEHFFTSPLQKCQMKKYVIALVEKFGAPFKRKKKENIL